MDGLSAASSVITVIQISGQVASLCRTYYLEVKDARSEIQRLREEVNALEDVLAKVVELADNPTIDEVQVLKLVNQAEGPVQQCQALLTELVTKLKKGQGTDKMKRFGLRAIKWPFSSIDVKIYLETITRHKATFTLALALDDIGLSHAIKADIAKLHDDLLQLQSEQSTLIANGHQQSTELHFDLLQLRIGQDTLILDEWRHKIHPWLSAPDPSSNHHSARKKQQATTGAWLVDSRQFAAWKVEAHSFLWLHGIPGYGKTVLCSTIIQNIISHCQSDPGLAIGFYYFDFNDIEKQKVESLIRSLVTQISSQSRNSPSPLDALYAKLLGEFREIFVIIDALDECKQWEELIEIVENIVDWKIRNLHLLVTSRRERELMDAFEPIVTDQIAIQHETVSADIQTHVRDKLQSDNKLSKWAAELRMEIESTLMKGAHGMFRWVVCQLDELRKCLKPATLRKTLMLLPKTLDDTYARILCNIDEQYSEDAFKILQWLAYSARPLSIEEVAEVLAVNIEGHPRIDPNNRLRESRDVLTICSSLITIVAATSNDGLYNSRSDDDPSDDDPSDDNNDGYTSTGSSDDLLGSPKTRQELRLAHFSVKEYLVSDRIMAGPASRFNITKTADDYIAMTCLAYLLHFYKSYVRSLYLAEDSDISPAELSGERDDFPLAEYAGRYWSEHARHACCVQEVNIVQQLCMELLNGRHAYQNSLRLRSYSSSLTSYDMAMPPLYLASMDGLFVPVRQLLENKTVDIDAHYKYHGTALEVASITGYEAIVELLLSNGANVNARNRGNNETALQAAIIKGHSGVVILLLSGGADLTVQTGEDALQIASGLGYEPISMTALQAASLHGHKGVIQLLLDQGADVHAVGNKGYETALKLACQEGHVVIVELLLSNGADPNTNALQEAAEFGHEGVVQLLLDNGAHIDALGDGYKNHGTALTLACKRGYLAVVQVLLKNGADVNARSVQNRTALGLAAEFGHEDVVQLLLDNGAHVNALGDGYEYHGTALALACRHGYDAVVQLLLDNGVDVNARSEDNKTPLELAADFGYEGAVQLLLDNAAHVNKFENGHKHHGTALALACQHGHVAVIEMLLKNGADVNVCNAHKETALDFALRSCHEGVVQLLLKHGAKGHGIQAKIEEAKLRRYHLKKTEKKLHLR
ncbi:hypothetical protein MMC17_003171 [Xylographa soralifera]|nr:hypothetical protein [Xylographa soralifera]